MIILLPTWKSHWLAGSLTHANYNLRNSYTDLGLPKPSSREFGIAFGIAFQSFGIAFLGKQKGHDQ
jgi:hypothetical protein